MLIHLGHTAAKSLCAPRIAAVNFLFDALCMCRNLVFKLVHLPRCFPTQPLPAKRTSKFVQNISACFLNFHHQNGGLLSISKLMFVYSSAAKLSTTATTTTKTTTCKSIDFFILNVFPLLVLQKPVDKKYRGNCSLLVCRVSE